MRRHRVYPQDEIEFIFYGERDNPILSYAEVTGLVEAALAERAKQAVPRPNGKKAAPNGKKAAKKGGEKE